MTHLTDKVNGAPEWTEIPPASADGWNVRLLTTTASFCQYPYWNEPYRDDGKEIHYLTWGGPEPHLYTCVIGERLGLWRVALVQRGPVPLQSTSGFCVDAQAALRRWAKRKGYVCLHFTHQDEEVLRSIEVEGMIAHPQRWPFRRDPPSSLYVERRDDDDATLKSFQPVARQEIKKAERAPFSIDSSDSVAALSSVWEMFERLAKQKGFPLSRMSNRPKHSWVRVCEIAQRHGLGRLYTARINGQCVQAIYVIRSGEIAEYQLGALDVDALGGAPSPSCLLHWHAMRDFFRLGCVRYNLGGTADMRTNFVWQFKRKFRPTLVVSPPPVTIVIRPLAYAAFAAVVLKTFMGGRSLSRRFVRKARRLIGAE